MKTIEMTGKTVDEALKNALNELKLTKEEVDIEIIDGGSKGIFNLIGNKPARIKITKKKSAIDEVEKFLTDVLKSMDIKAEINIKEENDNDDTEKELYASRIISEDDEHDKIIPITNENENKIAFKMFSTMYNKVSNEVVGE